jgi:hypothetical protein
VVSHSGSVHLNLLLRRGPLFPQSFISSILLVAHSARFSRPTHGSLLRRSIYSLCRWLLLFDEYSDSQTDLEKLVSHTVSSRIHVINGCFERSIEHQDVSVWNSYKALTVNWSLNWSTDILCLTDSRFHIVLTANEAQYSLCHSSLLDP